MPRCAASCSRTWPIGIGAGKDFDFAKRPAAEQQAIEAGIADAWQDLAGLQKEINAEKVSSADFFGAREFLKNNWLYRFAGAKLGLYGNSGAEAIYDSYFVDAKNAPADASKHSYELRFPKGQLPPAGAFWSITMYDGKTLEEAAAAGQRGNNKMNANRRPQSGALLGPST